MALYLSRFSYTTDAIKALLDQPQDRSAAAREMADSLGGKLLGFWYAFGEFDGVFLMEAPDNASAAAVAMAVGASGALSESRPPFCSTWTRPRRRCGRPPERRIGRQVLSTRVL